MRTTPLETIVFPATSATPPPLTSESEEPTTLDRTKPPIPLGQGSPDIGVMNNLLPASVAFVGMTLCLVVVVYFHRKRRMRDDQTRQPWLDSPSVSPTMTVKHTDSPSATSIAPYHPSLDTRNLCNDDESSCVVDPWFESGISSLASMDVDTTRFMEMVHVKVHVHALSNA
ncbi:hypothetical protein DYB36_013572 [Aphanomyces astaci]|uniref:Uncharacterized protein n=1 Tax=Aphanomyces astaci TaxID=112090 RepID=A0A397A0E2_APHAT|nr:hypothetical protein DYB36_013572 [Aphanomyces astaci]